MELTFDIRADYREVEVARDKMMKLNMQYDEMKRAVENDTIKPEALEAFTRRLEQQRVETERANASYAELVKEFGRKISPDISTDGFERLSKTLEEIQSKGLSTTSALAHIGVALNSYTGIDLRSLGEQIDEQKMKVVMFGKEAERQREVIASMKEEQGRLNEMLAVARSNGQKKEAGNISESILRVKDDIVIATRELQDFNDRQREAVRSVNELSNAYKSLEGAGNAYTNMMSGISDASQKTAELTSMMEAMRSTSSSASASVDELSERSAEYSSRASSLKSEIEAMSASSRLFGNNGSEEYANSIDAIKAKISEYGEAVAASAANASAAYEAQKEHVGTLREQVASLTELMNQAAQVGDVQQASMLAACVQEVSARSIDAQNRLTELAGRASEAQTAMASVASEQERMSSAAQADSSFFGSIIDGAAIARQRVSEAFSSISDSVSSAIEPVKAKFDEMCSHISSSVSSISQSIGLDRLGDAIGSTFSSASDKISNFVTGGGKMNEMLSSFGSMMDGLGVPFTKTVKGIRDMTIAAMKFVMTPIGAVITALAVALKAVHMWMTRNAEGQKAFAAISAYLGSIMNSLIDVVVALGKYIYHAFADNNGVANDYMKSVVSTFKKGFSSLKDIVGGFAKMLRVALNPKEYSWKEFTNGMKQLAKGLGEGFDAAVSAVTTGFKGLVAGTKLVTGMFSDNELGKTVGAAFNDMGAKASKAANLALQDIDNQMKLRDAMEESYRIEKEVAERRGKLYSLEGKERIKEAEALIALEKKRYEGQIDVAKKQLEIKKTQNSLHNSTIEDLQAERDLGVKVLQLQARQAASTRMLERMKYSEERKERKREEKNAKKSANTEDKVASESEKLQNIEEANAEERLKNAVSVEQRIADARISAIADGYQRTRAEREAQSAKEIRDIEMQCDEAVEAEKKRQKAEFDARNAVDKARGKKAAQWSDDMIDTTEIDAIMARYSALVSVTKRAQDRKRVDEMAREYDKQKFEKDDKKNKLKSDISELEELAGKLLQSGDMDGYKHMQALRDRASRELEWLERSMDQWNEYYTKYGTFIEKVRALDEKFIRDTEGMDVNSPKYKIKQKEYQSARSGLDVKKMENDMDWQGAFSGIGAISHKVASLQLSNLREYTKKEEFQGLDIQSKEKIISLIDRLEKEAGPQIRGSFRRFGAAVDAYNEQVARLARAKQEESKASESLIEATQARIEADKRVEAAELAYRKAVKDGTIAQQEAAKTAVRNAKNEAEKAKSNEEDKRQQADNAAEKTRTEESGMRNARTEMASAQRNMQNGINAIGNLLSSGTSLQGTYNAIVQLVSAFKSPKRDESKEKVTTSGDDKKDNKNGDEGEATGDVVQSIGGKVGGIVGAILGLLDKVVEQGGMNFITRLFGKISDVIKISLEETFSGEMIEGVAKSVWGIFRGLGEGLWAGLMGESGNWKEYEELKEKVENLVGVWNSLIEKKREYLSMSYGTEIRRVGEEAKRLLETEYQSIKHLTKEYLRAWETGSHSAGYYIDKAMKNGVYSEKGLWTWERLSYIVGQSVGSAQEIAGLGAEQLRKLKEEAGYWWVTLPKDFQEYLDKLIEAQDSIDDMVDSVKEKLLGISFQGMLDDFISTLQDMGASADDFKKSFMESMRNAIIENTLGEKYKEKLQAIYDEYYKTMNASSGKLSKSQVERFANEINELAEQAYYERDAMLENLGLGTSELDDAQSKAYANASEDSIEELSGRILAMNEGVFSIDGKLNNIVENVCISKGYLGGIKEMIERYGVMDAEDVYNSPSFDAVGFDGINTSLAVILQDIENGSVYRGKWLTELSDINSNTNAAASVLHDVLSELTRIRKKVDVV